MYETTTLSNELEYETINCDLCGSHDLKRWDTSRSNTLSQCIKCGLVFTNPRISNIEKKSNLIYSHKYFLQNSRMTEKMVRARMKTYLLEIDTLKKYMSSGRILDVGCGLGMFLDCFGIEWEKYGCDISSYALDIARKKGIHIYHGEFEKLNLGKILFDVVYFRASLHHAFSPNKCLKKAYQILKPKGVIAICMSNNCGGPAGRIFRAHVKSYEQPHNYLFSQSTLKYYLQWNGFKILEVNYPYFGTGYESYRDFTDFIFLYIKYLYLRLFSKLNKPDTYNFSSPTFYGNYINIYAQKET